MALDANARVRLVVGDLVLQVASLQAENEALQDKLKELEKKDGDAPSE